MMIPSRAWCGSSCMRIRLLVQQRLVLVGGDAAAPRVVAPPPRRPRAHADALGKLHGDLAVAARAAWSHVQLLTDGGQRILAASERAGQSPADPQAHRAERVL